MASIEAQIFQAEQRRQRKTGLKEGEGRGLSGILSARVQHDQGLLLENPLNGGPQQTLATHNKKGRWPENFFAKQTGWR